MRELASGRLSDTYQRLIERCDKMLAESPDTTEPPRYPKDMKWRTPEWREMWWGNRERAEKLLDSAATLGFAWRLSDNEAYGQEAKRRLLAAAQWDPNGSTSYRYNDEAGMPYAYLFSRTYTFIHPLLSEKEKQLCQAVMRVRGEEMYAVLRNRHHIWKPFGSHSNRAWHFLGEVALAFHGEIPEADEWLWFAMNIYSNVYPVWSGRDGGWHEGMAYFRSYVTRFLWWADIMNAALGISAFEKPFFSKAGYFPMYIMPPGNEAGGFGDQSELLKGSASNAPLMDVLAAQAGNGHWRWYVQANGFESKPSDYISFVRASYPVIEPTPPTDLPASRHFRGVGVASLNTDISDAANNVQILFKSSPFGTQSHGYESQNSFLLYLYGKRLFIRSGFRDTYGSVHHKDWMWHTKSVNNITVDGQSQRRHTAENIGRITGFHDDEHFAYVNGEAGDAYPENVHRYSRAILMVKPDLVLIFDRLATDKPATFQWHLHTMNAMQITDQHDILAVNEPAACRVNFLAPSDLQISQTDVFDAPLNRNQELKQHHLTAATTDPQSEVAFVTVMYPHRADASVKNDARIESIDGGYRVVAQLPDGGSLEATLHVDADDAKPAVSATRRSADGKVVARFNSNEALREDVPTGE